MSQSTDAPKHFANESASQGERGASVAALAWHCFGSLQGYQVITKASLGAILGAIGIVADKLLESKGMPLTTATLLPVMLSWQGLLLAGIGIASCLLYVAIDLFAHVYFCDGLMRGEEGGVLRRTFRAIGKAFMALPRFLTPSGLPTLMFILLLVPVVGVGFSVGLTRDLYVPRFIMEVVRSTPLYLVLYVVLVVLCANVAIAHVFMLPGVLLDGIAPKEARKKSRLIIRAHPWRQLRTVLMAAVIGLLITVSTIMLLMIVWQGLVHDVGDIPQGYHLDLEAIVAGAKPFDATDATVLLYRAACVFVASIGVYMMALVALLSGSYAMLLLVHLYRWGVADEDARPTYVLFGGRRHRLAQLVVNLCGIVVLAVVSLCAAVFFDQVFLREEPAAIVAHRLGGTTATENSLEGLQNAIDMGCYGAETDVQRTKDGHYVINHDNDFRRIAGDSRAPQDMTLAEVKQLRIRDANNPGAELEIPTIEEVLDASKGRIKLFVELKGATADHQMVDDIVRMVRERDAVGDVVLISLDYDVISYAEQAYPEFETGVLFFAGYGDLSLMGCDLLIMEEEIATDSRVSRVHEIDKGAGVWTVNTHDSMYAFLNSDVDMVITDELQLARDVQEELDGRDDVTIVLDKLF